MKSCTKCGVSKDLAAFSNSRLGKNGKMAECKACVHIYYLSRRQHVSAKGRVYRAANKDRVREAQRAWNYANRRAIAARQRERAYGLAPALWDAMLLAQRGLCGICGTQMLGARRDADCLCVDHCHTTGAVRGLLCSRCNKALGGFCDSPELLRGAINYLENSHAL